MKLRLACRRERDYYEPYDYEFHSCDPHEYWLLSYFTETKKWYADRYEAIAKDGVFDTIETDNDRVCELLAAMPIEALPVEVFI
jgi:hypothetical protein